MKKSLVIALIAIVGTYILFIDFNGFSPNQEDWVYGIEAFKMKLQLVF